MNKYKLRYGEKIKKYPLKLYQLSRGHQYIMIHYIIFHKLSQYRSHSHSEKDRHRPGGGRRALKSASELLSNDMVYCGLAGNSKSHNGEDNNSNDDDDTAEVFLSADNARSIRKLFCPLLPQIFSLFPYSIRAIIYHSIFIF